MSLVLSLDLLVIVGGVLRGLKGWGDGAGEGQSLEKGKGVGEGLGESLGLEKNNSQFCVAV